MTTEAQDKAAQAKPRIDNLKNRFRSAFVATCTFVSLAYVTPFWRRALFSIMAIFVGLEAEEISNRIVLNFGFKHNKAIDYIKYTGWISWGINSIVMWCIYVFNPTADFFLVNCTTFIGICSCHAIAILVYVKFRFNGEWKDEKNEERNKE